AAREILGRLLHVVFLVKDGPVHGVERFGESLFLGVKVRQVVITRREKRFVPSLERDQFAGLDARQIKFLRFLCVGLAIGRILVGFRPLMERLGLGRQDAGLGASRLLSLSTLGGQLGKQLVGEGIAFVQGL